jgi:hypothetical protein
MALTASQRRLERTIETYPPLIQAVAALAIGFGITFTGKRYVPWWLVVLAVVASLALVVGSGIWSWHARKALARNISGSHSLPLGRWKANNLRTWAVLLGVSTTIFAVVIVPTVVLGLQPTPDYRTPYDGLDPIASQCAASTDESSRPQVANLTDATGALVGSVKLRRSIGCSTVWAKVSLTPDSAIRLRGQIAKITMLRDADGAEIVYPLPLTGGLDGFGNMLSDSQACVRAEVAIASADGQNASKVANVGCQ